MKILDLLAAPWAIQPEMLQEITQIYSTHLRGEKIDLEALEARMGEPLARTEQGYQVQDGVAVIPIEGVIAKKMNLFSRVSGGASTQMIERDFLEAMDDPGVSAILLHLDTPGGAVDGTAELADTIYKGRGKKPIYALADGQMASAGVWIGSAADRVYAAAETTIVGSIGIVTQHVDRSGQQKRAGVVVTDVFAGRYKRITSENEPLSQEGRDYIQGRLDYVYSLFVDAVAKHRGVSAEEVLENMADGKIFVGRQAIDAGLVDGVATFDQVIAELSGGDPVATVATSAGAAGVGVLPDSAEQETRNETTEETDMDLATLREKHPDLVAALKKEGFDEGLEQGRTEGANGELERINSVRAAALPGHEALVEKLMFDGKTSGAEAAQAVLAAERSARQAKATADDVDAAALNAVPASVEQATDSAAAADVDDDSAPLEERARAKWDADKALRAEFAGDFDSFFAYMKSDEQGLVRVLGGKA